MEGDYATMTWRMRRNKNIMNKYLRWIDAWKAREWNMDEKKLTCFAVHRWRTAMTTTMKIGKNKKHMEKYDRKSNQPINQQNCIIICQMSGLSCNCITFDSTLYTAQHCTPSTGTSVFGFPFFFCLHTLSTCLLQTIRAWIISNSYTNLR